MMVPAGKLEQVERSSTSFSLQAGTIIGAFYHKL
jgi:hypothetical protein